MFSDASQIAKPIRMVTVTMARQDAVAHVACAPFRFFGVRFHAVSDQPTMASGRLGGSIFLAVPFVQPL